jgi:hypothetical protein
LTPFEKQIKQVMQNTLDDLETRRGNARIPTPPTWFADWRRGGNVGHEAGVTLLWGSQYERVAGYLKWRCRVDFDGCASERGVYVSA